MLASRNFIFDGKDKIVCGHFGVNFHHMDSVQGRNQIGDYSAGCQVVRVTGDYTKILNAAKRSAMFLKDKKWCFDYMLFTIEQMPDGFVKRII